MIMTNSEMTMTIKMMIMTMMIMIMNAIIMIMATVLSWRAQRAAAYAGAALPFAVRGLVGMFRYSGASRIRSELRL